METERALRAPFPPSSRRSFWAPLNKWTVVRNATSFKLSSFQGSQITGFPVKTECCEALGASTFIVATQACVKDCAAGKLPSEEVYTLHREGGILRAKINYATKRAVRFFIMHLRMNPRGKERNQIFLLELRPFICSVRYRSLLALQFFLCGCVHPAFF